MCSSDLLEIKVRISITTSEAQLHQVAIYPLVPSSGCLFKPIEGFLQPVDMGVPILDFEPQRLLYIHLFLYRTMQKCSLHIHLMKTPSLRSSKSYDRSNGGILGHRCKYVIIVYAFLLREATGNESCLELFSTSIRSMLDLVEPFRGDNLFVFRSWNHIPDVILHYGLILFVHHILPDLMLS